MKHPRTAFGVTPSRGRQQRPGKGGSALAWVDTLARTQASAPTPSNH